MGRNLGFTRAELLVVICTMASLMAIPMPVPGRVREKGRTIDLWGNLKQNGIALRM